MIIDLIHKIYRLFGLNPGMFGKSRKEIDELREKILGNKRQTTKELKKTNGVIKLLIEKGEIEVRLVKKGG